VRVVVLEEADAAGVAEPLAGAARLLVGGPCADNREEVAGGGEDVEGPGREGEGEVRGIEAAGEEAREDLLGVLGTGIEPELLPGGHPHPGAPEPGIEVERALPLPDEPLADVALALLDSGRGVEAEHESVPLLPELARALAQGGVDHLPQPAHDLEGVLRDGGGRGQEKQDGDGDPRHRGRQEYHPATNESAGEA
jgi:hypothetical protein